MRTPAIRTLRRTDVAKATRTCVYDRANLDGAIPLRVRVVCGSWWTTWKELLKAARIPGPYVLMGASGGGYITAGYAGAHQRQIAGLVFVDTAAPFRNPPREIVERPRQTTPETSSGVTTCRLRRTPGQP